MTSSRLQEVLAGILYCALMGKVNPGCQRVVTIFSGDVAQLVRATGLYSVLASDKRKVVGSSPTVPTVFGASSNGRTRVFGALNLGSTPSVPSNYSGLAQLVEQVAVNHPVAGSSPARGANFSHHRFSFQFRSMN